MCNTSWQGYAALQAIAGTLDGILDTVSAKHPLELYLATLKVEGTLVMLGVPDEPMNLPVFNIIMRKLHCGCLHLYFVHVMLHLLRRAHLLWCSLCGVSSGSGRCKLLDTKWQMQSMTVQHIFQCGSSCRRCEVRSHQTLFVSCASRIHHFQNRHFT